MTAGQDDGLRAQRIVSLLEDNIRTELNVQLLWTDHQLSDDVLTRITEGIAAEILYAFDVDWAPNWVEQGDVHSWQEDDLWYARCGACLQDSPTASTREEAGQWALKHQARHKSY